MSIYTCPFCNHPQTLAEGQSFYFIRRLELTPHKFNGQIGCEVLATACANPECGEVKLDISFVKIELDETRGIYNPVELIDKLRFRPIGHSKPQPDYIPKVITDDYLEACKIRDLNPKASATFARRCLHEIITDFCGIKRKTLFLQIETLRSRMNQGKAPLGVSTDSVDALDYVRNLGNITAQMKLDKNVITDAEPSDVQALIALIESLFDDWYVGREQRQRRFARLEATATANKSLEGTPGLPTIAETEEKAE